MRTQRGCDQQHPPVCLTSYVGFTYPLLMNHIYTRPYKQTLGVRETVRGARIYTGKYSDEKACYRDKDSWTAKLLLYLAATSSFSFSISATIASTSLVLKSFIGVSYLMIATSRFLPWTTSSKALIASLIT